MDIEEYILHDSSLMKEILIIILCLHVCMYIVCIRSVLAIVL